MGGEGWQYVFGLYIVQRHTNQMPRDTKISLERNIQKNWGVVKFLNWKIAFVSIQIIQYCWWKRTSVCVCVYLLVFVEFCASGGRGGRTGNGLAIWLLLNFHHFVDEIERCSSVEECSLLRNNRIVCGFLLQLRSSLLPLVLRWWWSGCCGSGHTSPSSPLST